MRSLKRLFIPALIGLTGLSTVQADITINRVDARSLDSPATMQKAALSSIYIVQMKGNPVISYDGDVAGYKATKPGKGQKINPKSSHVKKYAAYLETKQNRAIRSVGADRVYNYRYSLNGFAARMTEAGAKALRKRGDVLNVWKDEYHQLQTDGSPNYIGITEGGEAWSKGYTGEDVVIGVIDTGVWPEHPSFADVKTYSKGNKGAKKPYGPVPDGFTPSGCDFGNSTANPSDTAFSCNNKLLAARCFNLGFSSAYDPSNPCGGDGAFLASYEFQSGRDVNGHGSHTASTAGGNNGVAAVIGGEFQGLISGIAPRARIATYKACWDDLTDTGDGGCATSDTAAAVDQAVADGVDVINYSIGGSSNNFTGATNVAFLFAAAADVFVAASNGNAGPGAGTVGTPSGVPWLTAVGATQDDGVFYNSVVVNAPGNVAGPYAAVEGSSPVSLADTGPITDDVTFASDPLACGPVGPISGIALVSRGACSFTAKYNNVSAAGASAIIVFTDDRGVTTMSAPDTTIPGVMITREDGLLLSGQSGLNATLDAASVISAANRVAGFSSRGPNNGALDIIKPDVSAPGVAILAAGPGDDYFMSIGGTSMASPHVAGAFAQLKQMHPDWSAAEAKSALMTTGRQGLKKTFGDAMADPFDIGAGEILPSDAQDPGLAYHAGLFEYAGFTCGADLGIFTSGSCDFLESIGVPSDGSELNLPSIGIGELVGTQTITRTVTAVYNNSGKKTFTVSVDAPAGIDVSVSPSSFTLAKGASMSYEVTFTVSGSAVMGKWAFGSLTWTDEDYNYSVRSPIAVYPTAFSAPAEVDGIADGSGNGSVDIPVQFGYEGAYSASVSGLAPGFAASANLTAVDGVHAFCANLPANNHFRAAMFDEDTSDPGYDDLDLEVFYLPGGCGNFAGYQFVGGSYTPTTEETVDMSNGPAGGYHVQVYYFSASNGTDSDYTLWFQPVFGDEGNTSVTAPTTAVLGSSDTVTVDYTGLAPTRNLGVLHHADGSGEITRTILDIDAR